MRSLRRLATLLTPCVGVLLLLPELGHSLAHQHLAEHTATAVHDDSHHVATHHDAADHERASTHLHTSIEPDDHGAHADPAAPARAPDPPRLLTIAAAPDLPRAPRPTVVSHAPPAPDATGLSPGGGAHGPLPPSRAPPQT